MFSTLGAVLAAVSETNAHATGRPGEAKHRCRAITRS